MARTVYDQEGCKIAQEEKKMHMSDLRRHQRRAKNVLEMSLARRIKGNPKAFYTCVKNKVTREKE